MRYIFHKHLMFCFRPIKLSTLLNTDIRLVSCLLQAQAYQGLVTNVIELARNYISMSW